MNDGGGSTSGASGPACAKSPSWPMSRSRRSRASSPEHPDVSVEMRERVLAAVAELEYEPDFLAQSLRRGATLSVGYVVGDISNPLIATITSGAESVLRSAGLLDAPDELRERPGPGRRPHPVLPGAARRRHDPVARERDAARATLDVLAQVDVPIIMIDRDVPGDLRASIVRNDHKTGMRAAGRAPARSRSSPDRPDHRTPRPVAGPRTDRRHGRGRGRQGHRATRRSAWSGRCRRSTASASTEQLLRHAIRGRPRSSPVATRSSPAACERWSRHGVKVPEDVSLVTCDEVDLSELHEPPIASVARDTLLLGRTGGRAPARAAGRRRTADRPAPDDLHAPAERGPVAPDAPARSGEAPGVGAGSQPEPLALAPVPILGNDCRTATSVG